MVVVSIVDTVIVAYVGSTSVCAIVDVAVFVGGCCVHDVVGCCVGVLLMLL